MKSLSNPLKFLAIFFLWGSSALAQNLSQNPFVSSAIIDSTGTTNGGPLLPLEFNGTGVGRFTVGNTGDQSLPVVLNQEMGLTVSFGTFGEPNTANPSDPVDTVIGGPGKAYFEWTYNSGTRQIIGKQILEIPAQSEFVVNFQYRVVINSGIGSPQNGFLVNVQPPAYASANTSEDDNASSYTFVQAFDYGDAPSSYGVPMHTINVQKSGGRYTNFVYLGEHIDADAAAQHSPDATGDDVNNANGLLGVAANDEDGVVFPAMIAGTTVNLPVTFTVWDYDEFDNAVSVRLRGWIDWNGVNGFEAAEAILDDNTINTFLESEGSWTGPRTFTRTYPVTIPANATGNYFMRVRIGPNTNPTSSATYGEVEDHMFQIQQLPGSISGVVSADTTGDGTGNASEEGVLLTLLDSDGNPVLDGNNQPITTTTDSNGFYLFENVPPGSYQVAKTSSGTYVPLSDSDGGDPNLIGDNSLIVVVTGEESPGNNFLEFQQACPDTWTAWQDKWAAILDGNTDPADNPDGDRYSNLLEYAFCLPPHLGVKKPFCLSASATVTGAIAGNYSRTAIGGAKDVTYTLEWTAALGQPTTWTGSVVLDDNDLIITNDGEGKETVTIPDIESFTGLAGGSGFVRIRVDLDDGTTISSDVTDVLGWVQTDFDLALSTYNNPFLECAVFTGTVTSIDGQNLLFGTSADGFDLGSLLVSGVSYYIEVETGPLAGNRFDLAGAGEGAIVIASDSNVYSLEPPFNTIEGASPAGLVGSRIALHLSKTVNMLFPPTGFNASNDRPTADEVQVAVGGVWRNYWLFDNGGTAQWVRAGDGTNADAGSDVIPPGRGMFFNNRDAEIAIIAFGEVREQPFANPLPIGNSVVGGGYPVTQAFTGADSRGLSLAAGFFGSRDFKTADSVFRWRADHDVNATGYDSYFLLSVAAQGVEKWVDQKDASRASRNAELVFERDRSVFQRVRNGLAGYSVPAPWSPDAVIP